MNKNKMKQKMSFKLYIHLLLAIRIAKKEENKSGEMHTNPLGQF